MKLDEADEKLLALLKKDSRASNVRLAKSLGLTEGAVRWRIKRLVEKGAIRHFTVEVAGTADNYAVIMVKARHGTKRMMADISALGLHSDAYEISGAYDGCVILEGASVQEIDSKIDRIRALRSVAETETFISFRRW